MLALRRSKVRGGGLFSFPSRVFTTFCNAFMAALRSIASLLLVVTFASRHVFCSRKLVMCSSSRLVASIS